VILRRHLEKFSCSVEAGTELRSFEQSDEGVTAVLAKNGIVETFETKWMVGADGAKGMRRRCNAADRMKLKLISQVLCANNSG